MHCEYPHFAPLYGSNPQRVVDKCVDIVDNDGFILVSTIFYYFLLGPHLRGSTFYHFNNKKVNLYACGVPNRLGICMYIYSILSNNCSVFIAAILALVIKIKIIIL